MLSSITGEELDQQSREDDATGIINADVAGPGDPDAGNDLRGTYTYLMSVGRCISRRVR